MLRRRRFKQPKSRREKLAAWVEEVRQQVTKLPPGPERDALLKRASHADTASHLDDWANSTGLQPPR